MKEDEAIIRDILHNREKALEELYDRYAPSLLSLCYRYTGNMQDAEDVLHDGFIRIIKNLPDFSPRPDGSLLAWMKRIMINAALNFLRDHARDRKLLDISPLQDRINLSDENADFDLAHLPVSQEQILKFIGELPTGYRTVFNLYVFEDYSHKEICKQLNCTESTSKSQLSKARAVLRSKIFETVNILNSR